MWRIDIVYILEVEHGGPSLEPPYVGVYETVDACVEEAEHHIPKERAPEWNEIRGELIHRRRWHDGKTETTIRIRGGGKK